jgi:hypothetical protein
MPPYSRAAIEGARSATPDGGTEGGPAKLVWSGRLSEEARHAPPITNRND